MNAVFSTLADQARNPATGWSLGTFGALAEFHREADEAAAIEVTGDSLSVVTARGALSVEDHSEIQLVPYEGLSKIPTAWTQGVMVCLPVGAAATVAGNGGVADLGPDAGALRAAERGDRLFDLGFGFSHVDVCVRTGDGDLTGVLEANGGKPFLELGGDVIAALKAANPVRVFASKLGRIEVAQAIPKSGEASPMGPHTHILPELLGRGMNHAANVPVPEGWVPALAFYPAHPVRDAMGELKPFDRQAFDAFQALVDDYAPADIRQAKAAAWTALDEAAAPDAALVPETRAARTHFRVAVRQWAYLNGGSELVDAWRALCDPTRDADEQLQHMPDG